MIENSNGVEMLCQQDSYRKEVQSKVVSCMKIESVWEVETTDSLLYPMGGGQPSDYGWIQDIDIVDVQKNMIPFVSR